MVNLLWSSYLLTSTAGLPRRVTSCGAKPAVVILAADEYHRLLESAVKSRESFADHLMVFPGEDMPRAQAAPRDVSF